MFVMFSSSTWYFIIVVIAILSHHHHHWFTAAYSKNKMSHNIVTLKSGNGGFVFYPPSGQAHTATVILLHGLGDSGEGMINLAESLSKHCSSGIKFVMPTAPTRSVTVGGGRRM